MTVDRWDAEPIPAELALPDDVQGPPNDTEVDAYFIAAEIGTEYEGRVGAYRLDSDDDAEYYLRRMATTDRELAELREQADEWKARIDRWFDHQTSAILRRRTWWEAHLSDYAIRRRERMLAADPKDPRAKTLVLPSGKVPTSHHKRYAKITDPAAVVAWIEERFATRNLDPVKLGWIQVERKPVAAKIKGEVSIKGDDEHGYVALVDGQPVPGVEVEGENVTASVVAGP